MSACQRRVVAPVEPVKALSPQPRPQHVKLQGISYDHGEILRLSATAENASVSVPFTKQLQTWARVWAAGKRERIVYSSSVPTEPHVLEVAQIWAREFNRPELVEEAAIDTLPNSSSGLAQVQKALKHSFRVSCAYAEVTEVKNGEIVCTSRKLIGCARCVSDGYFAAQVVDCCVDLPYQRRGIGTKLLRTLCKDTRSGGAQSIAVFSAPDSRLFFWKAGFRMDFRYKIMVYDALKPAPSPSSSAVSSSDVSVEELSEIFSARR